MESLLQIAPYLAAATGLVVLSAFFSGTEVALFALRRVDREQMARSGRSADKLVHTLLEKPRRLIQTVLIGKIAVNATIAVLTVQAVALAIPEASLLGLAAIAVAIALPIVVLFGDVTAKTLALKSPPGWARNAAGPLHVFALLIAPVRLIVHGLSELMLKP